MNDLSDAIRLLSQRVEALERRISALEHAELPCAVEATDLHSSPLPAHSPAIESAQAGGSFPVLGKCMLGIAGAYLLRALAEGHAVPRVYVVSVAIVYALCWLFFASNAKSRMESTAWACTSVLILLPMLWELTVRMGFLPVAVSAGVLSAFVIAAYSLAWKRRFTEVSWVVQTATAVGSVALALATRHLIPFVGAILLTALMGEIAAVGHRSLHVRPLIAAVLDFAMFGLLWIYAGPVAPGSDYPTANHSLLLALGAGMLVVYAASATTQALLLHRGISFFETVQTLVALLFALWGVLSLWPDSGARLLGVLCLVSAAGGYALTFGWFSHEGLQRNYHVYATGSLALFLAACVLGLH